MQLAMTQRLYLALLWPLTLAGRRLAGHAVSIGRTWRNCSPVTPRPRAQRTVATLGAMAVAVVCAYLAMGMAGGLWIVGTAEYLPVSVFRRHSRRRPGADRGGLARSGGRPPAAVAGHRPRAGRGGLALLLLIPGATLARSGTSSRRHGMFIS